MKTMKPLSILVTVLATATLTACFHQDTNDPVVNTTGAQIAAVATFAPDYSSGAHSVVSVQSPHAATNNLVPTGTSDVTMAAHGRYFYRIERYYADNVTKFDIDAPDTPVWQYSTMDNSESISSSNPYDLVFASDQKAYLLRYGSTKAWIVNPEATSEQEFKTGELDLSAYADADGIPDMAGAVVVDNKLFVIMQRVDVNNGYAPGTSYVAVFDVVSDQEIDTDPMTAGLAGKVLSIKNPERIEYAADTGKIYIQGTGRYASFDGSTPAEYSGGIIAMDPVTFVTETVVDDGDATDHPYGNITSMSIVSATKGYFVAYRAWQDNDLYAFNPQTGVVTAIPVLENKNISDLAVDGQGKLWVGDAGNQSIMIIDPADGSSETVDTALNPAKIVFCDKTP